MLHNILCNICQDWLYVLFVFSQKKLFNYIHLVFFLEVIYCGSIQDSQETQNHSSFS
jgi:hypothetical protein